MVPQLQLRRLAVFPPAASQIRQFATSSALRRAFQAGDVVLLREKTTQNGPLVKLRADGVTHGHRGVIKHADIIGNKTRHAVHSSKGTVYRVIEPTLADYVRLTPRLVTPVRPACLCVSNLAQSTEIS
jgi:tRNA (adenine57-N1/adenine58-N1)-methyltransferase